jgi:hypothetical protein
MISSRDYNDHLSYQSDVLKQKIVLIKKEKVYCCPAALLPSFAFNYNATLLHDANVLLFEKHSELSPVKLS